MLTKVLQIATRARRYSDAPLHNVHTFLDMEVLYWSYHSQKKGSASGVDGETWYSYGNGLGRKLEKLLNSFRSGHYRAPAIRREYIPKDNGKLRPIGIPTIEDKVLQKAVTTLLDPIYEAIFKDCSYGFRQGRSQHQAIKYLTKEVNTKGLRYIIDADIRNFFGEIDHGILRNFLDHRINDGVVRRMIDKWLKAGVMEDKELSYPKEGTPQGGTISPLLSNIYLHYVLDSWFIDQIIPLLTGKSTIVRYADDFVLGFSNLVDAQRVYKVLAKRFAKYGLTLHPEKTKLIDLSTTDKDEDRSFEFLGFTHYISSSRKGTKVLKRKTSSKKLSKSLQAVSNWMRKNRHQSTRTFIADLNKKLRGHYSYYGISYNSRSLSNYYYNVCLLARKWLNRRGSRPKSWEYYNQLFNNWQPLLRPKINTTKA